MRLNLFAINSTMSPVQKAARIAGLTIAWLGIFYLCYGMFNHITSIALPLAVFLSGSICALTTFVILIPLVNAHIPTKVALLILAICIGAAIGMNYVIQLAQSDSPHLLLHVYAGIDILLIGTALSCGVVAARFITKATFIIPIAAAAGLADVWSVFWGVTQEIIQSRTAMNYFLLTFPTAGKGVLPLIGITDFIFATIFLSLSVRFDLPSKKTHAVLAISFILSILIAVTAGFGIPVLPIMGAGFAIIHYNQIKITDPKERQDMIRGLIIISMLLAALTLIKGMTA